MAWAGCTSKIDPKVKVWINLDLVESLGGSSQGTAVKFASGQQIVVADKPEDILSIRNSNHT